MTKMYFVDLLVFHTDSASELTKDFVGNIFLTCPYNVWEARWFSYDR